MDKILHNIINYRGIVWHFLIRTKQHLYYVSKDMKKVIDWNYSNDFVVVTVKNMLLNSKIDFEVIEKLKEEILK